MEDLTTQVVTDGSDEDYDIEAVPELVVAEPTEEKQEEDQPGVNRPTVEKDQRAELEKAQRDLEALDPETNPVRWVIGKNPENGGTEKQYRVYVQDKLPWMPRQKFFGLVTKTLAESVRSSGGSMGSLAEVFSDSSGGSLLERGQRWTQRDFGDLASFITTILELIGQSEQFMLDAYCIWLNVPRVERDWAKARFSEPWKPEDSLWGLKEEDHEKILNTFVDQNYEDIRRFLTETLPGILNRAALHEKSKERKPLGLSSDSDQLK
jgi:hypothetical protein